MRNFDSFRTLYLYDYLLAPFIIAILIYCAKNFVEKKYLTLQIHKYVLPALYVRIVGCILSGLMYQYYYGGGDTYSFFSGALCLNDAIVDDISNIDMLFKSLNEYTPFQKAYLRHHGGGGEWFFWGESSAIVCKIGAVLSFFTFKSYLAIGLILTYFAFLGCWKLFLVFYDIYPELHKKIAFSTLFIPSVFFWGAAGLMKDTIIMASLGYFTYGAYNLFIKKRKIVKSIFQVSINFYLIFVIKPYVVIAFVPALIVWIFLIYRSKIKNSTLKALVTPLFLFVGITLGLITFQKISEGNTRYDSKEILKYAITTQKYLTQRTELADGSGYNLGEMDDLTPLGILKIVPKAINVTLFRPYIWETKKPILIPSVLESLFFLLFTIYIFFKVGIIGTIKNLFQDPNVVFCIVFSLIFAFAVGFSTYNFGSLARYKIPCIPFYFLALFIMESKIKKMQNKN